MLITSRVLADQCFVPSFPAQVQKQLNSEREAAGNQNDSFNSDKAHSRECGLDVW